MSAKAEAKAAAALRELGATLKAVHSPDPHDRRLSQMASTAWLEWCEQKTSSLASQELLRSLRYAHGHRLRLTSPAAAACRCILILS